MEFLLWITLLSHRQSKHVGLAEKKIAMHEKWRNIFIIVCFDGRRQNHGSQCRPASWLHRQDAAWWQFLCYILSSKAPSRRQKVTTFGFKLNPSIRSTMEISGKLLKWSAVCRESRSDNPWNPLVFHALHHYWHVGPDCMEMSWTSAKGSWSRSDIYHCNR